MSKNRLLALSDGIFAVVLTILVLELNPPSILNHSSLSQYARVMAPLLPKVISFILTFVLISVLWVSHHYFFNHIDRITLGLIWLNMLFLLWLCFMPFPTAMLGDHPTDQFPVLLYGANQLLEALTYFAMRAYVSNNKLFSDGASAKTMGPRQSLPGVVLYSLSILLSFVNVYLSLACFLVAALLYFARNVIQKIMSGGKESQSKNVKHKQ
jgi:uncharacterized membrane protein